MTLTERKQINIALLSFEIDKYEYVAGEEILPAN